MTGINHLSFTSSSAIITLTAVVRFFFERLSHNDKGAARSTVESIQTRRFEYEFRHETAVSQPTELFVPARQYPNGFVVQVSDGDFDIQSETQTVFYRHSAGMNAHRVCILPL